LLYALLCISSLPLAEAIVAKYTYIYIYAKGLTLYAPLCISGLPMAEALVAKQ